MYIYCDVVVGDVMSPLLRIVDVKTTSTSVKHQKLNMFGHVFCAGDTDQCRIWYVERRRYQKDAADIRVVLRRRSR